MDFLNLFFAVDSGWFSGVLKRVLEGALQREGGGDGAQDPAAPAAAASGV
jgi:hypothetical protein